MPFLDSLNVSASGMTAQRLRMDTITENIANASTTRTAGGEAYRRRVVVMSEKTNTPFSEYLSNAGSTNYSRALAYSGNLGRGVKVTDIVEDLSDYRLEYEPAHPDADENGYVKYPNVDEAAEIVDMMAAARAFEANVTAFNATKSMATKAFQIGK